jgi:hypothetical protein
MSYTKQKRGESMAKCEKCNKETSRRITIASGQKICSKCYNSMDIFEANGLQNIDEIIPWDPGQKVIDAIGGLK